MSNLNATSDFQEFQGLHNNFMHYPQLLPQQMAYNPYAYGSHSASNLFVISCAALQRMMIAPESLASLPTICRCDPNVHQLRNSFNDQTLPGLQLPPPIYQTSSATFYNMYQNDEPDVSSLPYQSYQSYHTSAIPQTLDKQSKLRNNYPATNHTHQKNRKNKHNQFVKSTSNKKRGPNVYELIFKDERPVIPRRYEFMYIFIYCTQR